MEANKKAAKAAFLFGPWRQYQAAAEFLEPCVGSVMRANNGRTVTGIMLNHAKHKMNAVRRRVRRR
jgi:hypothetical protein